MVLSVFILSGCAAAAIGGYAYNKAVEKETCTDLMKDKDFSEKMKVEAYKNKFDKMCND